jgi:hypothetical protein
VFGESTAVSFLIQIIDTPHIHEKTEILLYNMESQTTDELWMISWCGGSIQEVYHMWCGNKYKDEPYIPTPQKNQLQPLWSSGQGSWLQIWWPGFDS